MRKRTLLGRCGGAVAAVSMLLACGTGELDSPARDGNAIADPVAPAEAEGATLVLAVAQSGNEARYRVREQLVGRDRPNDAVGATDRVSGTIALDSRGQVITQASRIVVDVEGLTSDQDRRDGYVRNRLLAAERYPTVEIQPTSIRGLPVPLPTSGSRNLTMEGLLTIRGTERPTTWDVDARFSPDGVTGTATTAFTFDQFQLTQPRVPIVASVADTIRLEYDFNLLVSRTDP